MNSKSSRGWREFQSVDLVVSFVNMESVAATSGENGNRANSGMRSVKILHAHRPLPHRQRPTCKLTITGLVVTENLVCMPTLCAGETDRGNRAAAVHQGPDRRKRVKFGHAGEHSTSPRQQAALLFFGTRSVHLSERKRGMLLPKRHQITR
jgi:hypothetical protein